MSGGLFGGYNKLQNALYSSIDEANAIRLEKAAREYSDYMKNAYRLMNDPNLREIAERRIGDTTIPAATRTASRETGEMNFGNVLKDKAGTVSAEQMYGVKLSQENRNESFDQWAAREDAEKKKAAEEAANHIKEQIRKNQELLNTKEVASRVNVPFESINEKRNIREWATDTLANSGYRALNPELGTVIFDKKRISGAVKYLKTPTEFAAFAALPDVIAKGSVLAMHEDHKGRNYGTYTIIAPIEINGQRGNMAVVVKKTSDNFYKVHRILAPDGKILDAFETKNTDTRNAGGYTENDGAHAQRMMSVSDKSIQQEANTVNSGNANNDIKTQSLEEYLGERELSSPVSDYNIDKTRIPHGETQRQRDARIKAGEKANNEYSEKRKAAIEEYNAKVERGEIKEPSQIAKTVNKAQGYLDNDSVAAARRMAEKRGYDWMSGE